MESVIALDKAGVVAILLVILAVLAKVSQYLLTNLIADKNVQIARLSTTVDKLTVELGATLDAVLTAVKEQARAEADERRRNP